MQNQKLNNWKGTAAIVGIDWGDSGKGRLVDDLSVNADIIARYNGGSNTGHTVENDFGKFALHIIPSGIFNKKAKCLVGRNVAVDIESLLEEMKQLDAAKVSYKNLVIDGEASLIMPWHRLRDGIREKIRKSKVGTTGKGIGPLYADRTERVGILVKDLLSKDLAKKIKDEVEVQNKFFTLKLNKEIIVREYIGYSKIIRQYIGSTVSILRVALSQRKSILFEGAQGYFLDIDAGTYPFVTSSNPGLSGIIRSFDIHPTKVTEIIGITKAYTSRVGEGPMPTKMKNGVAKRIIKVGKEIGTTTGRVRSPGWLDLELIKEAAQVNGLTSLAITKLDVLTGMNKLKLATGYKIGKKRISYPGHDSETLSKVTPIYIEMPGWQEDISGHRKFNTLPANAKKYVKKIEEITNVPVKFISVGPKRGQVIYR